MKNTAAAALLFGCTFPAFACDGLVVEQAWIREAPPGATVMAGYAVLKNRGNAPVDIGAASSPAFGAIEVHRTVEQDGMSKMLRNQVLSIAPGHEGRFERGGYHLMLFRPQQPLKAGDKAVIELSCGEKRQSVEFGVRKDEEMSPHAHAH